MYDLSICMHLGFFIYAFVMPCKTKEIQKAYQRKWVAKRRSEWLLQHGPCIQCGSWHKLQVDHIDPSTKVSHSIWSWTKKRREEELAKCQVLCCDCHSKKTALENSRVRGEFVSSSKLTNEQANEVRMLYNSGAYSLNEIGIMFGIHKTNVSRITRNLSYN
jgi:hypothetical protein